jgi:hypothetical protein
MNMPTGTAIIRGKVFSTEPGGQSTFGPNVFRTAGDAQLEALKLPSNWNNYNAEQKIDYYNRNNITADKLLSAGAAQSDIDWMLNNGFTGKNWDGNTPSGWENYTPAQKISFFNTNNVSPDRLKQMGVPQSDIDYMLANGYTVKSVTAPLANNTNSTSNSNTVVTNNNNNNTNTTTIKDNLSADGRGYVTVGGATYNVYDVNKKPPGNWKWNPEGDVTPGFWTPEVQNKANGTTNVKGYYNGTSNVTGYANGTMGVDQEDDPWAWTRKETQAVSPLSSSIKPSTEQAGPRVPDATEQALGSMATAKGLDIAEKGINAGYQAYKTAAPLAEAATTGATMAEGATLTSALGAGGSAMMGALASNPVGWAIGAGLLAKKLKLF